MKTTTRNVVFLFQSHVILSRYSCALSRERKYRVASLLRRRTQTPILVLTLTRFWVSLSPPSPPSFFSRIPPPHYASLTFVELALGKCILPLKVYLASTAITILFRLSRGWQQHLFWIIKRGRIPARWIRSRVKNLPKERRSSLVWLCCRFS